MIHCYLCSAHSNTSNPINGENSVTLSESGRAVQVLTARYEWSFYLCTSTTTRWILHASAVDCRALEARYLLNSSLGEGRASQILCYHVALKAWPSATGINASTTQMAEVSKLIAGPPSFLPPRPGSGHPREPTLTVTFAGWEH
jgi:hypothetical protein